MALPPYLTPEEEQKPELDVEACLHSMTDEAMQKLQTMLAEPYFTLEERKRLTAEYLGTAKRFLRLAEKKVHIMLEREHQERQGIYGERVEGACMMNEQQTILDRVERERKILPVQALPPQPPRSNPRSLPESIMPTPPSDKPEYHEPRKVLASRTIREFRTSYVTSTDSREVPSILDKSPFAKSPPGQAQMRSRHPTAHEVWKPMITREEDAQMSRTLAFALTGSTARATLPHKAPSSAPSVLSPSFSHLLHPSSANTRRERTEMHPESDTSSFSRLFHPSSANTRRERTEMRPESDTSSFLAPAVLTPVLSDTHDTQLNMDERASTYSEGPAWSLCGSPKRKRDVAEDAHERTIKFRPSLHSLQTVVKYYFEEHELDDADVRSRRSLGDELQIQDELYNWQDDANGREELERNVEDLKREREDEEAKRREEELQRKEAETDEKEREAAQREEEAKRKEEEAEQKEKEARKREIETRRKEEEVLKMEQRAKSWEIEARRKAEAARRKEEEVRRMEEEARHKEYGVRQRQEEARKKEEEAQGRTEEIGIKAEKTQRKEEELRKRERKLRRREQDLNRREADVRHREEEETHRQKVEEGKSWFKWRKKTKEGS